MTDRPKNTIDQPFRSCFLHHLEPSARRILEQAGFFTENAFLETYATAEGKPYPLTLSQAVLEDARSILFHLGHFLDEWEIDEEDAEVWAPLQSRLEALRSSLEGQVGPLLEAIEATRNRAHAGSTR